MYFILTIFICPSFLVLHRCYVSYSKNWMEKKQTRIMGYGYAQKEHMLKCVSATCTTMTDLRADPDVDTRKGFWITKTAQSQADLKDTQSSVLWPHRIVPSHFLWPVSTICLLCLSPSLWLLSFNLPSQLCAKGAPFHKSLDSCAVSIRNSQRWSLTKSIYKCLLILLLCISKNTPK